MEQMMDEESIFLTVGRLFYRISKNRVQLKSSFLRWCMDSYQRSEFVRWISLGGTPSRRLFIVQLNDNSVDEGTLAKVAHYVQTDQLVDLNAFNVVDILKAGQILGVTDIVRICSSFLAGLVGQLLDNNATELTILRKEVNYFGHFPNKTFLIALMVKTNLFETNQYMFWKSTDDKEDSDQGQAPFSSHSPIPWSLKYGVKRKSMFSDLATEVAHDQHVFDDSEILYMMEMTSVPTDQEVVQGIDFYEKEREDGPGSPRTLPEEWLLSPAKSVNLEDDFPDMDREFLNVIYNDDDD